MDYACQLGDTLSDKIFLNSTLVFKDIYNCGKIERKYDGNRLSNNNEKAEL